MEFYTYILISEKSSRLYIGHPQHIKIRIEEHNSGKTKSTKNKGPWQMLHKKQFAIRKEAIELKEN